MMNKITELEETAHLRLKLQFCAIVAISVKRPYADGFQILLRAVTSSVYYKVPTQEL